MKCKFDAWRESYDDTKCYGTNSKNRRKDRSTTKKISSSRGKPPLHYINEQLLDDTNDKNSLVYI